MPFVKVEGRWYVIEFASNEEDENEEAESEVVPDFWLGDDGKHVLWPPTSMKPTQVIKAIASRKNPSDNWVRFSVQKMSRAIILT